MDRPVRPPRSSIWQDALGIFALFGRRYCDRYCAALLAMLSTNIAAVCGRAAMCEEHACPGAPGSQPTGRAPSRGAGLKGPMLKRLVLKGPSVEGPSVEGPSVEGPSVEGPSVEGPSVEPRLVVVPAGGWLGAVAVHEPQSIVAARLGGSNDRKASARGRPPRGADAIKSEVPPSARDPWRGTF